MSCCRHISVDVKPDFPLPSQSPMTLTLSLRYLDVKLNKYRVLELQCPNPSALDTHSLPVPATSSTVLPQTIHLARPKFRLLCSTHHMRVELPPGPISGIVVMGKCVFQVCKCVFQVHMVAIIPA